MTTGQRDSVDRHQALPAGHVAPQAAGVLLGSTQAHARLQALGGGVLGVIGVASAGAGVPARQPLPARLLAATITNQCGELLWCADVGVVLVLLADKLQEGQAARSNTPQHWHVDGIPTLLAHHMAAVLLYALEGRQAGRQVPQLNDAQGMPCHSK